MKPTQEQLQGALRAARRKGSLCAAERYLQRKGILCFGVESVSCADRSIEYVNLGDTYDTTIIDDDGDFAIASWGGWYEETEREHCEEEGVIRCGYCGEFTPCAEDWTETVCQHCGRYVQTGEKPAPKPDPENLDDMPLADLQAYCHNADNPAALREYAAIKARAMQSRLGGRIQQAQQWEKALDGLYDLLPETLQW